MEFWPTIPTEIAEGSAFPRIRFVNLGMRYTTIRAIEADRIEELCLDQPNVTEIPKPGDTVMFAGGPALVENRVIVETEGGHLSVLLRVQRRWTVRRVWPLLSGFRQRTIQTY